MEIQIEWEIAIEFLISFYIYWMKQVLFLLILPLFFSCSKDTSEPIVKEMKEEEKVIQLTDDFAGNGALIDYVTNNESALPDVSRVDGRYKANLIDNSDNITLHYHEDQGRLDAKLVSFPFEFIARNIGIGTQEDSQSAAPSTGDPFNFAGVQVHIADLSTPSSSHVVVGHRGATHFTIEGKNTINGTSSVDDIGANTVPNARADIRIVGNEDRTLTVYWQVPNLDFTNISDSWTLYNATGGLPGEAPAFGESVYVGLITYAFYSTGLPFVGTCDAIDIN
jgi:hypothetical protein